MLVVTTFLFLTIVCGLSSPAFALYDNDDTVSTFTDSKDFRNRVLESSGITLIQFYAPWCGHCKQFVPAYQKIASLFDGIVSVGAIDASSDGPLKRVANDYGVTGFPTLKIFRPNINGKGAESIDLNSRDPNEIINSVMQAVQMTIQERAGGGDSESSSGGNKSSSSSKKRGSGSKSFVQQLTMSNFQKSVYENSQVVAIAFIAPWCGHCKSLLPEWEAAAEALSKSGAMLATVDATVEQQLGSEFGVQGYPTIKLFSGGKKSSSKDAVDYQGGRTKEQIVSSILAEVDRSGVPKEIPELVSPAILEDTCGSTGGGQNVICVLVALPHILETGAEGRNKYKNVMTAASKSVRGMAFEFLWFEGGNHQHKLENDLDLTFGFPAVAAYSMEKQVYAVHRGSFTESNLRKFLMGIMAGKTGTYPMKDDDLVVVETEPWDGKDGVPIEEESLADIMGWDDDDETDGGEL
jgi:protein disulfide-isomerase A6